MDESVWYDHMTIKTNSSENREVVQGAELRLSPPIVVKGWQSECRALYVFSFTILGVPAKLSVVFFAKKFSLLIGNYFKITDKKWKHHFLKKSKQTAEISWHFFLILVKQKNGFNEIALKLSKKFRKLYSKTLDWKKNLYLGKNLEKMQNFEFKEEFLKLDFWISRLILR